MNFQCTKRVASWNWQEIKSCKNSLKKGMCYKNWVGDGGVY